MEGRVINNYGVSDLEFFFRNTRDIWYYLLIGLTLFRVALNMSIYYNLESPLAPKMKSDLEELGEMIPKKWSADRNKEPMSHSSSDFKFLEFTLICLFTLWWGDDLGDNKKIIRLKRFANILNITSIPLLVGIIVMYFQLQ